MTWHFPPTVVSSGQDQALQTQPDICSAALSWRRFLQLLSNLASYPTSEHLRRHVCVLHLSNHTTLREETNPQKPKVTYIRSRNKKSRYPFKGYLRTGKHVCVYQIAGSPHWNTGHTDAALSDLSIHLYALAWQCFVTLLGTVLTSSIYWELSICMKSRSINFGFKLKPESESLLLISFLALNLSSQSLNFLICRTVIIEYHFGVIVTINETILY